MFHKVQELVQDPIQLLGLFNTFLDKFGAQSVNIGLNGPVNGLLAVFECQTQVIKRILLEPLVLRECGDDLGRDQVEYRLQEVEKPMC